MFHVNFLVIGDEWSLVIYNSALEVNISNNLFVLGGAVNCVVGGSTNEIVGPNGFVSSSTTEYIKNNSGITIIR